MGLLSKFGPRVWSEGEVLELEMAEMNHRQPGWDRELLIIDAMSAIGLGMPEDMLRRAFSEATIGGARERISDALRDLEEGATRRLDR